MKLEAYFLVTENGTRLQVFDEAEREVVDFRSSVGEIAENVFWLEENGVEPLHRAWLRKAGFLNTV